MATQRTEKITSLSSYFKLKEPTRAHFRLSPEDDAGYYIDLDGVLSRINSQFQSQAPQFVIQGDIGTGKSHILQYIAQYIAPPGFIAIYITLSGFNRKADFYIFHRAIIDRLLPFAREAMRSMQRANLNDIGNIGSDMKKALEALALSAIGKPHPVGVVAEQWLSDSRLLTAARASKEGYSGTLREKAGPSDLVELYKVISELYFKIFGKRIILLIDEGETFSRIVDVDAQASIGAGLRSFFDADNSKNQSIGFVLGLNTPRARADKHPVLRSDVRSRIGDRLFVLQPLNTPERIHRFIEELWRHLSLDPTSMPFMLDRSAQDLLAKRLDELRKSIFPDEDLSPSPTQRDLLEVLSKIGESSVEVTAPIPLDAQRIRRWFGLGDA